MRIDPKLIMEFAAIAEEGSFTRAAQRLRVAQPWLSSRLRRLEDLVGVRLLDRTSRTVSLTRSGEDLLEVARDLSRVWDQANLVALGLRHRSDRVLRVGAAPYTTAIGARRDLIHSFSLACPDVSLVLETGWSPALLGWLDEGQIELCFIMGDVDPARYERIVLGQCGVAVTFPRDHPLAAMPSLSPQAAAAFPLRVYPRSPYPKLWDTLYAPLIAAGAQLVQVPDISDRRRSPGDVTAFFDFGEDDPEPADVVRVPLDAPATTPFQLLRRAARLSPAGQTFWEVAAGKSALPK